jgi:hypothetical protein
MWMMLVAGTASARLAGAAAAWQFDARVAAALLNRLQPIPLGWIGPGHLC